MAPLLERNIVERKAPALPATDRKVAAADETTASSEEANMRSSDNHSTASASLSSGSSSPVNNNIKQKTIRMLSASEELRTQICSNQFCQCIRRDQKLVRVQDLIRARLVKNQKRIEQLNLEREARDFLASLDGGCAGNSNSNSNSNSNDNKKKSIEARKHKKEEKAPGVVVPPQGTPLPHPSLQHATKPLARAALAAQQAQLMQAQQQHVQQQQEQLRNQQAQQKLKAQHQLQPRVEVPLAPQPQLVVNHQPATLHPRVWKAYGDFSRKTKRVEAVWDDYEAASPANKRAKRLPSWVVPRTIETNTTATPADRRTSESDMTATSELTMQSAEVVHVLRPPPQQQPTTTMMTTATTDDNHTHVVSLASQPRLVYHLRNP